MNDGELRAKPVTLTAKLAAFFRERPGVWHDGRVIAGVAGYAGFRGRISDIRRPPFNMRVENRTRRPRGRDGIRFTVSEYRYIP